MRLTVLAAVVASSALGTPRLISAQFGPQFSGAATSVTLTVPVKLTQLSPDLERVKLMCQVGGEGITIPSSFGLGMAGLEMLLKPVDDVMVTSGQLVTTLKVMAWIPVELFDNPIGKTAMYQCRFTGYSKSLKLWGDLHDAATDAVFNIKPTPQVQGTFVW